MSDIDWIKTDAEDIPHLLALVAEHVLGLDKVGLINGKVWYTDWSIGVFQFTLNWETVKDILSLTHVTIQYDDNTFWAWYREDRHCPVANDDPDVALCIAALRFNGWEGNYNE